MGQTTDQPQGEGGDSTRPGLSVHSAAMIRHTSLALALLLATAASASAQTEEVPPAPSGAAPAQVIVQGSVTTASSPVVVTQAPAYVATCPEGAVCETDAYGTMHAYRITTENRMDRGLVIGGAVMLGVAWAVNILGSALSSLLISIGSGDATSYFCSSLIPIAGPIAQMVLAGDMTWTIPILAVMDGVEIAGLIMAIVGTVGSETEVRTEVGALSFHPWAGTQGAGLATTLSF